MKGSRILIALIATVPVVAIVIYLWNPLDVPTLDPRGRVLGVIPYRVPSVAMEPTIADGSLIAVCTAAYLTDKPKVGDVIAFVGPADTGVVFVKRVMGIGGDSVAIRDEHFVLNNKIQTEPYTKADRSYPDVDQHVVPEGHVFVLGDNRGNSRDSRHFGPVTEKSIIGKMCAQFDALSRR